MDPLRSIQYSVVPAAPLDHDVLAALKPLNIRTVLGHETLYDDLPTLKAALNGNGLTMPVGAFKFALLEAETARCISIARTIGITTLTCSALKQNERPTDTAGWQDLARRLNGLAAGLESAGLRLAVENGPQDFTERFNDDAPFDLLLGYALDVGWRVNLADLVAGSDATATFLERHRARIQAVNLQGMQPKPENDAVFSLLIENGLTHWVLTTQEPQAIASVQQAGQAALARITPGRALL